MSKQNKLTKSVPIETQLRSQQKERKLTEQEQKLVNILSKIIVAKVLNNQEENKLETDEQ